VSKPDDTGYCLRCLRDHLHKVRGVLREAVKQWRRSGQVTEGVRRKVELAEEELSSAETEHIWNVQLEDEEENRRLKEIGVKLSNIRKGLETTQIGFPNPKIKPRGTVEDLEKAIKEVDSALGNVHEALAECKTCASIEEFLERLKTYTTSLGDIERQTAERVLTHLSQKYGVPKPKLRIVEDCPLKEPSMFGAHRNGEIEMCKGGVDVHKLAHEFKHYMDSLKGLPCDEEGAEEFALKETSSPSGAKRVKYNKLDKHFSSGGNSLIPSDRLKVYGPLHVAKGVERGLIEVDRITPGTWFSPSSEDTCPRRSGTSERNTFLQWRPRPPELGPGWFDRQHPQSDRRHHPRLQPLEGDTASPPRSLSVYSRNSLIALSNVDATNF